MRLASGGTAASDDGTGITIYSSAQLAVMVPHSIATVSLATAMLPPLGRNQVNFRIVIVGPDNSDPYAENDKAIEALARHFGLSLPREECFPYA